MSEETPPSHIGLDPASYRRLKRWAATSPAAPPPALRLEFRAEGSEVAHRASGPPLQRSFAGIDLVQPFNFGVEPPDSTVAANAGRVLEATNAGIRLTRDDGTNPLSATLQEFFGEPPFPAAFLFDPRVFFDRNALNRRFFLAVLERDSLARQSWLHLAVSRSDRPAALDAASWCRYKIDFRDQRPDPVNPDVGWADFPQLGVGADALLVATNQWGFTFGSGIAYLRVFHKLILEDNAAACPGSPMYSFVPAQVSGNINDFTLSPVQHYSAPASFPGHQNPAYVVSNLTFQNTLYRVWRVSNVASGNPTLDLASLHGSFYDLAPDAAQAGSSQGLDTLVPWISQAAGVGNAVWATHSTVCNVGGGANESCIRVLRFEVGQAADGSPTATLSQELTFGGTSDGVSLWMPGLAVNQAERTLVSFHTSSPASNLSVWYTTKGLLEPSYASPTSVSDGTCPGLNNGRRNGDYVTAFTDPDFTNFWVAGERSVELLPEFCEWQTWIAKAR
ncbi:MAG: hypothetical protein U0002_17565 [Thermoanaerobaculia bacterium]